MGWLTPTLPEATNGVRGPTELEYLKWVKVHLSHPVASVGSLSSTLRDFKWHCHNHSSSWRKTWCHLIEEQLALRGDSSSALPGNFLELAPQEEEDHETQPKVPPLGFKKIAKSLTRGKYLEMEINCPLTRASLDLLPGSTVATVTSATMCQDQTAGILYLSKVTTSMGLMNLKAPSVAVGHWVLVIEEPMEHDLAESHLK